ncbi:hypothetical protein Q6247_27400, partial [Klebsiella pneumoniae]
VHFSLGLQNGFTLQCLDLREIDEAKAEISRAKQGLKIPFVPIGLSRMDFREICILPIGIKGEFSTSERSMLTR